MLFAPTPPLQKSFTNSVMRVSWIQAGAMCCFDGALLHFDKLLCKGAVWTWKYLAPGHLHWAGKAQAESHCKVSDSCELAAGDAVCLLEVRFPAQDLISLRVFPCSLCFLEGWCHVSNSSFSRDTMKDSKHSWRIKPWVFPVLTITWGRRRSSCSQYIAN